MLPSRSYVAARRAASRRRAGLPFHPLWARRRRWSPGLAIVCIIAAMLPLARPLPLVASGESPLDTVYVVPEIIVEAPRLPRTVDEVFGRSAFVAVVDLGERRHRTEDLSSVLSQLTGIRVRQYGGLGSFATVSIRGSSSSHVNVYLDGVPLNDGYGGVTDIGGLPLDGIRRIEVFRGSVPPHLGSSSIGGAVNLVTQPDSRRTGRRIEFHESYGSFGTERHTASLWSTLSRLQLFAHAGLVRSDGDFEYVDDWTTPFNPADNPPTRRRNNDSSTWNVIGRGRLDVARGWRLLFGHNAVIREHGVPGLGSRQSSSARAERAIHISDARLLVRPLFGGRVHARAGGFYSTVRDRFHDPGRDIGLLAQDTDNRMTRHGADAHASAVLPRIPVTLEVRQQFEWERFVPRSNLPSPVEGPERTRRTGRSVVSADLFVEALDMTLTHAQRWNRQTTSFYDPPRFPWLPPNPQGRIDSERRSPHYGFRWQPAWFHGALTLKGNWSHDFRQPTMLELFGNAGSVTGNAALVPEAGVNRDVGVILELGRVWRLEDVFVETAYIHNDVENLIVFFPNSQYTARPENMGSARIRGWELSLSARITRGLTFSASHTQLATKDTGRITYYNGNDLPGRPQAESALAAEYRRGRWKLAYDMHRIGSNFLDPANHKRVPARTIHGSTLTVSVFHPSLAFSVEGRNLGDSRIADVSGFPLPGRSVFAGIGYQP